MGARLARVFRNFNVENRALREISREKPRAAPRHETEAPPSAVSSEAAESVKKKDESLLEHLRTVYVESTDPAAATEVTQDVAVGKAAERRPLRVAFPGHRFGLPELHDVPKGKLTIAEALKALGSHQHQPRTWTAEKIAQEYSLDLKDTTSVVEFFIPFKVEIIPPKTRTAKQIKAS
ncbi:NADH dehydrogenase [ubiquinone] 1 alpha subcomplex assembly factor 4 [Fundulus heteroclitus]|uniref:NADH dehydrogenase [ubiquinone] 1 alpha subcomplex assembly factor 4 n=1 Tax=Fundulus heteroclitus TaxID=8078 RepID=UPI00165BEB70|nr:NADH dehydrogenase [ubiquinone] 1 alpha subcomplex assembly factor 4 [Fundulus heteroclitus]